MSKFQMFDLNRVFLAGRLTRDPELRYTPQGTAVAKLGLAVSRQYTTSSGEKREDTLFVNVDVWDKQAEFVSKYFVKGRPIFVEGRLRSRSWETDDGQRRSVVEVRADRIQFMDWVDREESAGPSSQESDGTPARDEPPTDTDDDVPF